MKVLFLGDIFGSAGRRAVKHFVPRLRREHAVDLCIGNSENSAGGSGVTIDGAEELLGYGLDLLTSGNHIWDKREIYPYLESSERVLRPLNYGTTDVPGRGWGMYQALDGTDLVVINLQGRTYMQPIDNPFGPTLSPRSSVRSVTYLSGPDTPQTRLWGQDLNPRSLSYELDRVPRTIVWQKYDCGNSRFHHMRAID